MFYAIINLHNVDFAQLIWNDFLVQVLNVDPIAKMFATGERVQEVVGIPVGLLTEDIKRIEAYHDYVDGTLSAPRSPKLKSILQKFKGKIIGESSEPRKPLRIKDNHPKAAPISFTVHVLTSTEIERHQVDDAILTEQVEQMVEGKDVEADTFADTTINDDDDMIDNVDHDDQALTRKKKSGSSETRNAKMHTPIPTPPRSPRINLSSDKEPLLELTDTQDMFSEVLRRSDLADIMQKIDDALCAAVPWIAIIATNEHLKDNLLVIFSQELATSVSKMIEDLFKEHMESIASNVYSSLKDSIAWGKFSKKQKSTFGSSFANVMISSNPTSASKTKVVHKPRTYASQPTIPTYDDNWSLARKIDDGVDIFKEADTEFLAEI
ncbi:hypothetical protein Tco_0284988 [Tanacetum coccineum]